MGTDTKTEAPIDTARPDTTRPDAARPERFEDILARLRGLVDRLEGGNLPLEDSLRAFEEGMELCRRGTVILDGAEKKVETLLAAGRTAPFEHEDKAAGDK